MTPIFGHDGARAEILEAAVSARLHHGWILAGPSGIGKASLARQIALILLAGEEQTGRVADGHPAGHLFAAGTHPDFAELARLEKDNGDLARNISVDQIRGLGRFLSTAPSLSARRVIMIDAADDMERGAANALLKNLEEPPRNVVFLLISHAPSRLLPTIRSRCRMLRLSPLDDSDMDAALRAAAPEMDATERMELARIGEGSPGRALALSGLGMAEIMASLARIAATGDPDNGERIALARMLGTRGAKQRFEAFLERVPAFIAQSARGRKDEDLATAITAWESARDLAAQAVPLSLDPAATVFELCGLVASLAEMREPA
ncbi:MAG: DNA polymerase III subunit delta' [Sphingobium sp.]